MLSDVLSVYSTCPGFGFLDRKVAVTSVSVSSPDSTGRWETWYSVPAHVTEN